MTQQRELIAIPGNSQRLDGGSMFGNAPKVLWSRWIEPDERNRIPLACRALLVREPDGRQLLFETGIGAFFAPKLRDRYGVVEANHVLLESLEGVGLSDADIDVVVLSHLHFDHAGGLLTPYRDGREPELLFPRARFVCSIRAWERATNPHSRDRVSFIPQLHALLEASGRLLLVDDQPATEVLGPGFAFSFSDGHTPGLLLTEIATAEGPVLFAGDLIPGAPWMHLPITMGYDRYPELLIDEKESILSDLFERGGRLFFTHDAKTSLAAVGRDERGGYVAVELCG